MNSSVLKEKAKQSYRKQTGAAIVVALIMSFFSGGASFGSGASFRFNFNGGNSFSQGDFENSFSSIVNSGFFVGMIFLVVFIVILSLGLSIFLAPIFTVGGNRFFLKLRKNTPTEIGEVVGNFKDGNYMNIVGVMFFKGLFIYLWSLLLVIPGIIKGYEYMMIDYILAVRPDIDRKSAFNMSKALMDGHKAEAFVLGLSFIGWYILSIFTCGILTIAYVNPYMHATFAEFYGFVRDDGLRRGVITEADLPDYGNDFQNPMDDFYNNISHARDNTFYGNMSENGYGNQNPQQGYNAYNNNMYNGATPPPATPAQPTENGNIPYDYNGTIETPPTAPQSSDENENHDITETPDKPE